MTTKYAVFGQPVVHSLSPRIHAAFAAQLAVAVDYRAIEAGQDDFASALDTFSRDGGRGANVTLPLKQAAVDLCATLSARARRAGSVNTLVRERATWHGDSTDGAGLLRDLHARHAFEPRDRTILLLGAGGAARATALALADAGLRSLVVANRTPGRAHALVAELGIGSRARAIAWDAASAPDDFDLVVNATAAGHGGAPFELPQVALKAHTLCYDLSYGNAAHPFLDWARAAGATRVIDGLGMLVEQAAESFALWHQKQPDTEPVYAAMRALLDGAALRTLDA